VANDADADRPQWLEEPWEKLVKQDGKPPAPGVSKIDDGFAAKHRKVIKTHTTAPHLAFIMPVGDKEEQDVLVDQEKKERRVMPGYRYPGLVPAELMMIANQIAIPPNVSTTWMVLKNNISAILREIMTKEAIRRNANFIYYWDDDVFPPPDTVYKMLNHMARFPDIGAITGVVWTKTFPSEPLVYKDANTGAYWGMNRDPNAEPEDIYAAGAGSLMVRVQALRQMKPPYWHDVYSIDPENHRQGISGHDIRLMRKMRDETGYRVTVDGSIECRHFDIKNQLVFERPPHVPTMQDGRDQADLHAHITEEEKKATPPGPDMTVPMETAAKARPKPDQSKDQPVMVIQDVSPEEVEASCFNGEVPGFDPAAAKE
jgi:hypothetical protein